MWWLAVLVIAAIWGAPPLFSQDTSTAIKIIHVSPQLQADQMALSVFFHLVDESGRPLPDASLQGADVLLLSQDGSATAPVSATLRNPQTPIYVALLLDTSGSMVNAMPAVREAAKAMIEAAPPNMSIAVIPFNDVAESGPLVPLSNFTTNHGLVQRDIEIVQAQPGGATCLYNAAYNAIELLETQTPSLEARRAVILFTDGRDEMVNGQPCSRRTYADVIARATTNPNNLTPIFTIGLKEGANPRLDEEVLSEMAIDTNAYYAIGDRNGVSQLFEEIMGYLNSQWVAFADVRPHQGINQAELRVNVGGAVPLRQAFNFTSSRSFVRAEETIAVRIENVSQFDATNQRYQLSLSVDNPRGFAEIVVKVIDHETNTGLYDLRRAPESTLTINLDASTFKPDQEYRLELYALDETGVQIPLARRNNDESTYSHDIRVIKHVPPPPPAPIQVTIVGADADFQAQTLTLDLRISDATQVDKYQVSVTDPLGTRDQSDVLVFFLPPPGQPLQVRVPLPPLIAQIIAPREFSAVIDTWNKAGALEAPSEALSFVALPPPQPTFWQRIGTQLQTNTTLQIVLVLAVVGGAFWFLWPRKSTKQDEAPPPLPIDHTDADMRVPGVPMKATGKVRVRLIRAPNQSQEINVLATQLPVKIGRGDHCKVCLRYATTDRRISREHAEVRIDNDFFYLVDLNSDNGTFVSEKRLEAHKPLRIQGVTRARLGPETLIEIEPEP